MSSPCTHHFRSSAKTTAKTCMETSASMPPFGSGTQKRMCTMFFLPFIFSLYHPFLRPVKLTMLGGETGEMAME